MSLRVRLTIWYGGFLILVLGVIGVSAHSLMQSKFDQQTRNSVVAWGNYVARNYELIGTSTKIEPKLPPMVALTTPGIYLQIMSTDGKVLDRSESLGKAQLPLDKQGILDFISAKVHRQPSFEQVNLAGDPIEVYFTPLVISPGDRGPADAVLMVGKSMADARQSLQTATLVLLGGGAVLVALVIIITWLFAGAAMRPIEAITRRAAAIADRHDFSGRVHVPSEAAELQRLGLTFNRMLESLEAAYAAQKRFLADASHELRTPLTAVRANLEYLETAPDAPVEERALALRAASKESERMGVLVNDLLALSRADAGQTIERAPVELDRVVVDAYRRMRAVTEGVRLTIGGLDEVVVQGDSDRLLQLTVILLDNAVKYSPAGGCVTLRLERISPTRAAIRVSDEGMGVALEDREQIFERFYRSPAARQRAEGSGLGLSIARWIARAHGGDIVVGDAAEGGAEFTVTLPSIAGAPARPMPRVHA